MKTNFDFDEFIKNFYNNKELDGFILRVRANNDKDKNDTDEDKASNIAYYNGIKAFDVVNDGGKAKLEFPVNVYKCNTTDVRKKENEELEEYKESKISLMDGLLEFTSFSFNGISYCLNENSTNKDKYEKVRNDFELFVKERYNIGCSFSIKENKETKYIIKFDQPISEPRDIVTIQCKYIELFKYKSRFDTITKDDKFDISIDFDKGIKFSDFISHIKMGISNYKSSDKLEKKYQHYFMLKANESKALFPREDDEVVVHFEQEYGIINKNPIIGKKNEKDYKTGRIDCIFYKYKMTKEKIFNVSDIYLVEIKVDDSVILGNNGVMTHLEDIKAFLDYKEDETPKKYDITTLTERIDYRNKALYDCKCTNFNDTKVHFYTVIGFTNEDDKKEVKEQIKCLVDFDYVKGLYKRNENLYSVAPDKSKCDIKFFFEKTLFNLESKEISTDFEDVTEELAPGFI